MACDSLDMSVQVGSLTLQNPITVASGTFGYGAEYEHYYDIARLGAITTKSISLKPRSGNKTPRIAETPAGMLNAIGLQNVGLDVYLAEKVPYLRSKNVPIIANIYGASPEEYAELAERLEEDDAADAIEANLSCPNVHDVHGAKGPVLVAQDSEAVAKYTRIIREATHLPLIIKLSPNVASIIEPALAAQENGADGLCLINTLLGMALDIHTFRPKLANIVGGLSGPCIRPVALKMVWDVARTVNIPIIGTGGICTWEDAVEFLLAGAIMVSIGSMSFREPCAAMHVLEGLEAFLVNKGMTSVHELIGAMKTG